MAAKARELGQVRCLGIGPEHWFYSADRCRNRICMKCVRRLADQRISHMCANPVKEPEFDRKGIG